MKRFLSKPRAGFTLVELIVSVAITAVLMVGLSAFFSSSFRNIFQSREQTANLQSQFLSNVVFQEKFSQVQSVVELGADWALLKNNLYTAPSPFTYMTEDNGNLVFSDFFVFNGWEGDISSYDDVSNVDNPAGVTKMGDVYYVVASLEDAIYQCSSLPGNCESKLNLEGLKRPIDVTNDGSNLYITDAGNGRVVKISNVGSTNDLTVLASELKFPTGIEYYAKDDGYLFFSETYAHEVKRLNLSDNSFIAVAGGGPSDLCDGTAQLCQLSFPTGLLLHDDGQQEALYIAEMGTGRILKVTDPQPDLTDYDFAFLLDNTQIKRLEFVFPEGISLDQLQPGATPNTVHLGAFSTKDHIARHQMTATLKNNTYIEKCDGDDPPNCENYFHGFLIDEEDLVFEEGDELYLDGKIFTVLYINPAPEGFLVGVLPDDTNANPPLNSEVALENKFSGEQHFFWDMSQVPLPAGFNLIGLNIYTQKEQLATDPPDKFILRIGDGLLGGPEDFIGPEGKGVSTYLTDLGWQNDQLVATDSAKYSKNFANFDYRTKFEVQNLEFATFNNGSILELIFQAFLAQDAQGEDHYETYHLNAGLEP